MKRLGSGREWHPDWTKVGGQVLVGEIAPALATSWSIPPHRHATPILARLGWDEYRIMGEPCTPYQADTATVSAGRDMAPPVLEAPVTRGCPRYPAAKSRIRSFSGPERYRSEPSPRLLQHTQQYLSHGPRRGRVPAEDCRPYERDFQFFRLSRSRNQ